MSREMGSEKRELYFVFMKSDPEFNRLQSRRKKRGGGDELDLYIGNKHDDILADNLEPGTYIKTLSFAIVDAFAALITHHQADVLRSVKQVRLVEKNLLIE